MEYYDRRFTGFLDNTEWDELSPEEQKEFLKYDHVEDEWCGKKIYEGDVILLVEQNKYYEIFFSGGCFRTHSDILCNIVDKHKIRLFGKAKDIWGFKRGG